MKKNVVVHLSLDIDGGQKQIESFLVQVEITSSDVLFVLENSDQNTSEQLMSWSMAMMETCKVIDEKAKDNLSKREINSIIRFHKESVVRLTKALNS